MGSKNSGPDDIFSIIRKHYVEADPALSITQIGMPKKYVEVLERWLFIDIQRSKNYPRKNTKEILTLWQRKYDLSEAQFYIDKRNCERLLGETCIINPVFEKRLSIEAYDMLFSLALAKGDIKSAIEAQKQKDLLTEVHKANDKQLPADSGERTYQMIFNMVLDGKKVGEKKLDISKLQLHPIKEIKEYTEMIDIPEANIEQMENIIDALETKKDEE